MKFEKRKLEELRAEFEPVTELMQEFLGTMSRLPKETPPETGGVIRFALSARSQSGLSRGRMPICIHTLAQCTIVRSACHRRTNAFALAQVHLSWWRSAAEGSQDSAATDREQTWSSFSNR